MSDDPATFPEGCLRVAVMGSQVTEAEGAAQKRRQEAGRVLVCTEIHKLVLRLAYANQQQSVDRATFMSDELIWFLIAPDPAAVAVSVHHIWMLLILQLPETISTSKVRPKTFLLCGANSDQP